MEINSYQKADKLDSLSATYQSKGVKSADSITTAIPVKEVVVENKQADMQERIPVLPANFSSEVNFDKDLDMLVVNIMEKDSGEVIKTIPSEEILSMMRRMNEMFEDNRTSGMLVDLNI